MGFNRAFALCVAFVSLTVGACAGEGERTITILATNDIHGGVEPSMTKEGKRVGGLALFAGAVRAIRESISKAKGSLGGTLVVDAGDQFQGTLISNFTEGELVFAAMNEAGYDAVLPGNHDYDFGPIGWLEDQVTPESQDQNPRGALLKLAAKARFPLISASTYISASLVDETGAPLEVDGAGCTAKAKINWKKARRPEFLTPYVIKKVAGVRVALIGIDNPQTPKTTTPANVTDLCFRDEADAYLDARAELEGKADVFVGILHDGDIGVEGNAKALLTKLTEPALGPNRIHALVAGHTHAVNNGTVRGVPYIQSGSGGTMFGRIELAYDPQTRAVTARKAYAGISLMADACAPSADFCQVVPGGVAYDGAAVVPSAAIETLIADARAKIAPIAGRKLGVTSARIAVDRTDESPLANALTDTLRAMSGADIAFMNTGGIRAPIDAGDFSYEEFFKVIPFNNHALEIGPMPAEKVLKLLERSAATCGSYGALMQSGLRVSFTRRCSAGGEGKATLKRVETLGGQVILDTANGIVPAAGAMFQVATLDFLAAGGSGYDGFAGTPVIRDLGIVREKMADWFVEHPAKLDAVIDGRWARIPEKLEEL